MKFNIGLLGIGDISDVYIANLQKYEIVNVAACAARNIEKARKKAEKHHIPKVYATPQELIADPEIDIILNLTIPAVHGELNLQALRAGKHVYSEKPLAATFAEAQEIVQLAQQKGLYVGCAPDTFLGGRLQTIRQLIDNGVIGEVTAASAFVVHHGAELFHPNPNFFYEEGAGPLLDIGPYYMTALLSLFGPAERCCAMGKRTLSERVIAGEPRRGEKIPVYVDTHITGSVAFKNGVLATITTSFDVWDSALPRLEFYGTKGTICVNDPDPLDGPNLFGGKILLRTLDNCRWKTMPRAETYGDWEEVPIEHKFTETSHQTNSRGIGLVDMAYAIQNGRPARASAEMALHSLEVMERMLQSNADERFYHMDTTFALPAPLPKNFPENEKE